MFGLIVAGCAVVATVHYVNGNKQANAVKELAQAVRAHTAAFAPQKR